MKRAAMVLLFTLFTPFAACGGGGKAALAPGPTTPAAPHGAAAPEDLPSTTDPWSNRSGLIVAPPPAPAVAVTLPKVERFTLPNGLKVLVVAAHDLPVVTLRLVVRAGNQDETRDKRLLADYAALMLTRGTARHSADEIAGTMDFIGGRLSGNADLETTAVTCEALAKDLATCLTMLPEVVLAPSFPQEEMKRVSDHLTALLNGVRDNPETLASQHLDNLLWGDDHVRGFPNTVAALQAISRKDLLAWHQDHFTPGNAVLAIAGDVDVGRLRGDLGRAFGAWKARKAVPTKTFAEPKLKGLKVRLVDNPELTQSQIMLGGLGVAHGDKDYLATLLVNYCLGGGAFSSRLMSELRVAGGKTYGASSDVERWRSRGAWVVKTVTRTPETLATLKAALGVMARMQAEGPTADELAAAKANLSGSFPMQLQGASDVVAALLRAELHGLGDDWVRNYPLAIDAVTLEEARAVAKKRLDAADQTVVIVGKVDEIAPQLEKEQIAFERVGYLEAVSQKDRGKKQTSSEPLDARRAAAARKLLDAALAAKGGADKLRAIKDVVATGKAKLIASGQSFETTWTRIFVPPDNMAVVVGITGMGDVRMTITPEAVFQRTNNDPARMFPSGLAEQARGGLWRNHDLILLRHLDAGTQLLDTGRTTVGTKGYDYVVLRRADGSNETRMLIDPQTKMVFRLEYSEGGAPASEEYGAYRAVDGIQMPFHQRAQSLEQTIDVAVSEIKLNGGVPAGTFERPQK